MSALFLLPGLVAVAAAQPVVVRQQLVRERGDAQAFFVIDTSLSMEASGGPAQPTRLGIDAHGTAEWRQRGFFAATLRK